MKRTLFPVAVLTVLYLAALALWPEALNHNSEYQWPVLRHGMTLKLVPAGLALILIMAIIVSHYRKTDWEELTFWKRERLIILVLLTGVASQVIPMTVHRMGLLEFPLRVYLADHTSYFTDAVLLKKNQDWMRNFPELVPQLHTHSRTHPPGAISLFQTIIKATEFLPKFVAWYNHKIPRSQEAAEHFNLAPEEIAAGGISAFLLLSLALLSLVLFYQTGMALVEREDALWLGVCFFLFTPTFSNKSPILDQLFAFFIFFGLNGFTIGIKKKEYFLVFAAGIWFACGLWWSYTFLAALPLACLIAFSVWWKDRSIFLLHALGLLLLGFLTVPLLLSWVSNYDLVAIYRANLAGWHFNNTVSGRIHMWKWILFNPYEFFAWLGVPIFLLFALAVWREIKKAWRKQWDRIDPFTWAIVLFGIALDLSGRVCYESPRLAWFYAPLVCLVAAKGFTETEGSNRAWPLAIVLVLQAATVLVFRMLF
ncbi:MAG: hypothetical protein A2V67_18775 [Deltaproteobacteria bacterium RBG_13_61_14]|nr:MAG: hypothetical protein A2V67_18775 [Deltaproteobacteria bacterium RBG_13_61_14]